MKLFDSLFAWFTRKTRTERANELKQAIPEEPVLKAPPPPIRKGSLEDIRDFCDEMRKDLKIRKRADEMDKKAAEIRKQADNRLYVEFGNLRDKIKKFLEGRE